MLKNGRYEPLQLHHAQQNGQGSLFELTKSTHTKPTNKTGKKALHPYSPASHPDYPVDRDLFDKDKAQYWKDRFMQLQGHPHEPKTTD